MTTVQFLIERSPRPKITKQEILNSLPYPIWVYFPAEENRTYILGCNCDYIYRIIPEETKKWARKFNININETRYLCNCYGKIIE